MSAPHVMDVPARILCMLQVEPGPKGHCISLHYSLTASTKEDSHVYDSPPAVAVTTAQSSPLYATLHAALTDAAFLPAGANTAVHACTKCLYLAWPS